MPAQPTLGQIMPAAFNLQGGPPRGWALCNGAILPIQPYQALFSLLGTQYGGNGTSTFALPDLRGRAILGSATAPLGQPQGTTTVTLNDQQMPSHNHMWNASTVAGTNRAASPANNLFGVNTVGSPVDQIFLRAGSSEVSLAKPTNVTLTGGNAPHNNMQPYLAINYMIALQGVYPSRL